MIRETDILIIGAGAVGCAIARELSVYGWKTTVLEKEADAGFGASGRNSGVVHAGFNNAPFSMKAMLCREGSRGFEKLASDLGIGFRRTGKLVIGNTERDLESLTRLKKQGETNEIEELEILDENEIRSLEPALKGKYALWSGRTGIFDPFEYTLALAEDAASGGVRFLFAHEVKAIRPEPAGIHVRAEDRTGNPEEFLSRIVINAAGTGSAGIFRMTGKDTYHVLPCRGEYHLLEKGSFGEISRPVYPVPDPDKGVLGIHLTPTLHGNLMIGPSAEFLEDPEDMANTAPVMEELLAGARCLLGEERPFRLIRSFSGIRPRIMKKDGTPVTDFRMERDPDLPGMIHLLGIESPGITASVPIAGRVMGMLREDGFLPSEKKKTSGKIPELFPRVNEAVGGRMICRCETVTEGEILQAVENTGKLGALPTMKGIKNRTRASMGSCQGGFCTLDISRLLRDKAGIPTDRLTYDGPGSELFTGVLKGGAEQ